MGYVYKARQLKLDRFVALKILPETFANDPAFAERFAREGRLLAKLNHPNIVSVYDFGQTGDFFYLLMEYVDGVNLRQAMQASRFSPPQALEVVPAICEALQFAHDQGVLHRDIKPENILLDTSGRIKIADFGIAKFVTDSNSPSRGLTATDAKLGTPHYMAPEQVEHPAEVDHRADIYSLGVVFYELLTGELPLGRFSPPSGKTPVDARVDDVVMRALDKERDKRQQSATELRTQVETISEPKGDERPDKAPTNQPTVSLGVVLFYAGLVPGCALVSVAQKGAVFLFLVAALLVASPLIGRWVLSPSTTEENRCSRLRGLAWVGFLMSLPVCGFGLFFISALLLEFTSSSGWNPALSEAILVPLATAGAVLLPLSSARLWHASTPPTPRSRGPVRSVAETASTLNPWPRRVFLLIIFLVVAPIALLILMLLLPLLAYKAAEAPQAEDNSNGPPAALATPTPTGTLVGELPQGGLELVAISNHPSETARWWRPNGSWSDLAPFKNDAGKVTPNENDNAFEIVIRSHDLPAGTSWPRLQLDESGTRSSAGHPLQNGQIATEYYLFAATLSDRLSQGVIRVGVAVGT